VSSAAALQVVLERCRQFERLRGALGADVAGVDCNRLAAHYLAQALAALELLDFTCKLRGDLEQPHAG
jgi:hypothetical protein